MQKIGIFVDTDSNLYTNGAIQQAYFTYVAIKNTNIETIMLAYGENKCFQIFDIPVYNIDPTSIESLRTSLQSVTTIIFTSKIPTEKSFVDLLKSFDIQLIYQICGNYYIINQEDFVFDVHKRKFYETSSLVDKIWILPMYEHMKSYIETITKVPVFIAPYIWNADILNHTENNIKLPNDLSNNMVFIAEPNVSIHKTALIPILICEKNKYNKKILCLCSRAHEGFKYILSKLNIFNQIEFHQRLVVPKIIKQIVDKNIFPIMISHQIMNELNFILYFIYPRKWHVNHNMQ